IKPLVVYPPALAEGGYTAATVVDDAPVTYRLGNQTWSPRNFDGRYRGLTTLREAVRRSVNVVAAKVLMDIGPDLGIEYGKRFGLSTLVTSGPRNDRGPALALGGLTRGVSVLEMAAAYAVFASGGVYREPIAILRVEDAQGRVLEQAAPAPARRVLTPQVAYLMVDILRSVVEPQPPDGWIENTSTAQATRLPGWQAGGKTGTTSDNRDVWFVGFTPRYAAAVWIGYDNRERANALPRGVSSGRQPVQIWRDTMLAAHKGLEPVAFERPPGLVTSPISAKSGLLPGPYTPSRWVRTELFVQGSEPRQAGNDFVPVTVCANDPSLRYEPACACEPTVRLALVRPPAPPGGPAPEDAAMAAPARSCLDPTAQDNGAPDAGEKSGGETGR
ncbi:MAG: penicillin-binding protein, partial [Clostridia bacterium]|nr:penicillin-binding protein [Clostridia bacterium]